MRQAVGIAVTALGISMLIAGCTRTSDGSIELRKSAMLSRVFGERRIDPVPEPVAPPVYAEVAPPAAASPPASKMPKVTVPALTLTTNPPFTRPDPDKPLYCRNETTTTGRIRVVCS